ncbi:hypothetical protein DFP72DRAFT_489307 [Ephemerocybe angulata]|uniref:Uncharacterized protein n=1 Tax=Ephemerocybe angulata TaxID=980116 RepID=A0A8H6MFG6_9AGAR|nr:hypothetical protein DFP72DRAFT_489307 [Tulosesus angulatus]
MLWALLFITKVAFVGAQSCRPGFEWANNERAESPCTVAGQIKELCAQQAPESNGFFQSPKRDSQNSCTCSGVYYSLVAACSVCARDNKSISWSHWSESCSSPSITDFGRINLEGQVAIPAWVRDHAQEFINRDGFDPAIATLYGGRPPETTGGASSTVASTTTPGSSTLTVTSSTTTIDGTVTAIPVTLNGGNNHGTGTFEPDPTGTGTSGSSGEVSSANASKSKNMGAIIGGAVGGVIFLVLLVAALVFFVARRRRSRMAPSTAYLKQMQMNEQEVGSRMGSRAFSPRPFSPRQPGSRSATPNINAGHSVIDSQDYLIGRFHDERQPSSRADSNASRDQPRTITPLLGDRQS